MESSGVTPQGGVAASDLAGLMQAPGPFATVYLTTEASVENAGQRSEQRWRTLRAELAAAGATEDVLAAIDPVVPNAHLRGEGLAVVANGNDVLHVEHAPYPPRRDLARWASVPLIVPVLEWRQSSPPHVALLADRHGADLFAFRYEGADLHQEVDGERDYPMRKVAPGGWSQRRFQERAENTWEQNAGEVAEQLVGMVSRVRSRAVIAAGDVRALQMLQDSLPKEIVDILEVVPGARSTDGRSIDDMSEDVRRVVERVVAADTAALLEKFREELGQGDRASDGPSDTMRALALARVDVLLVHDDWEDERPAWFGPGPTQLADRAEDLRALGVEAPLEGRLVDVLVRGALGGGASVRVVPAGSGLREGVGAILRWS